MENTVISPIRPMTQNFMQDGNEEESPMMSSQIQRIELSLDRIHRLRRGLSANAHGSINRPAGYDSRSISPLDDANR